MFKRILTTVLFATLISLTVQAQRVAVVDVSAILDGLPEYTQAQTSIDNTAAKWRQEIAEEYDKIKSLYNKYQAEQVLLSDEAKTQKEEEIMKMEKSVRQMQNDKFGPEGELFKQRQALVSPIQDKVYTAIEDYAAANNYDLIFDKGSSAGLLFINEDFDKTDNIKKKLRID